MQTQEPESKAQLELKVKSKLASQGVSDTGRRHEEHGTATASLGTQQHHKVQQSNSKGQFAKLKRRPVAEEA